MFFNDRETIIRLTPEWTGERLPDGRPKVSRDILFTYCPIAQEIAAGLISQTSYADAAKRHTMELKKLEKNITNVMHKFTKNALDVPPEIEKTRKYLLEA